MLLASMDLWNIVDGFEENLSSNMDLKVLKEYQRHVKKAIFIIGLNLVDNLHAHIKNYQRPAKA